MSGILANGQPGQDELVEYWPVVKGSEFQFNFEPSNELTLEDTFEIHHHGLSAVSYLDFAEYLSRELQNELYYGQCCVVTKCLRASLINVVLVTQQMYHCVDNSITFQIAMTCNNNNN